MFLLNILNWITYSYYTNNAFNSRYTVSPGNCLFFLASYFDGLEPEITPHDSMHTYYVSFIIYSCNVNVYNVV